MADKLGCRFLEGDDFHDPGAIAKMRAGRPLDDDDRWPWLDRLGSAIGQAIGSGDPVVAACSALKHRYRQRLCDAIGAPAHFVFLDADREELQRRLTLRPGHYMPASLLDSQLATLERPGQSERVMKLDAAAAPEQLCEITLAWLARPTPA